VKLDDEGERTLKRSGDMVENKLRRVTDPTFSPLQDGPMAGACTADVAHREPFNVRNTPLLYAVS